MHCPIYYTDWWLKHPQYWVNDTAQGWHSAGALDFEHQEVRGHKLAIISEQLENYADYIDGYELDFMHVIISRIRFCKTDNARRTTYFLHNRYLYTYFLFSMVI